MKSLLNFMRVMIPQQNKKPNGISGFVFA